MNFDSIFFRVDATVEMGMGHAKRCMILAREILKSYHGKIYFLTTELPEGFKDEIRSSGIDIITRSNKNQSESEFIISNIDNKECSALIIDSYLSTFYEETFQKKLLNSLCRLVYIAFDNKYHYYAHILHNQNPLSLACDYRTEPYTKRLFGLQYLILNEEIRTLAKQDRSNYTKTEPFVALLSFGGSDPGNLTLKALESLSLVKNRFKKYIVVIGGMNPHETSITNYISSSEMDIELNRNVSKMHKLMLTCDIAFTSGGITTWELGALGKPVIILPTGEREYASAKFLNDLSLVKLIEQPLALSSNELAVKIDNLTGSDLWSMAVALKNKININGVESFVKSLFE